MSSGPDGYASGMVWENAPRNRPPDSLLLKIAGIAPVEGSWGFSAKVDEGPASMIGNRHRFISQTAIDCDGVGSDEGYIVVSRTPIRRPVDDGDRSAAFLEAHSYEESWWNWIGRMFGGSSWAYPGKRIERPEE
tara:strand:- start:815 stop:1216 length:402 start_codon:yes stop_codon:yes gene_type:complete